MPEQTIKPVRAWQYIKDNYEPHDRLAVVLVRAKEDLIQRIATAESVAGSRFQHWLWKQNSQGYNIYVSVNTLRPDATGRRKDDVQDIRHIYLDLDKDGPAALNKILSDARLPQPNYIVHSSPGKYQVLWKVEGFNPPEAEALQRSMVREYGADPAVWDSARVLRIPGFFNKKYADSPRVTAQKVSESVARPEDFKLPRLYEYAPFQPTGERRPRIYSTLSQSERDWAYAMRALARGDDPSKVIASITAYRPDKKNPASYAEYTVGKAAQVLEFQRRSAAERPATPEAPPATADRPMPPSGTTKATQGVHDPDLPSDGVGTGRDALHRNTSTTLAAPDHDLSSIATPAEQHLAFATMQLARGLDPNAVRDYIQAERNRLLELPITDPRAGEYAERIVSLAQDALQTPVPPASPDPTQSTETKPLNESTLGRDSSSVELSH